MGVGFSQKCKLKQQKAFCQNRSFTNCIIEFATLNISAFHCLGDAGSPYSVVESCLVAGVLFSSCRLPQWRDQDIFEDLKKVYILVI